MSLPRFSETKRRTERSPGDPQPRGGDRVPPGKTHILPFPPRPCRGAIHACCWAFDTSTCMGEQWDTGQGHVAFGPHPSLGQVFSESGWFGETMAMLWACGLRRPAHHLLCGADVWFVYPSGQVVPGRFWVSHSRLHLFFSPKLSRGPDSAGRTRTGL